MKTAKRFALTVIVLFLGDESPVLAQSAPAFDVATVKVNKTGGRGGYPGLEPGGKRFRAMSLPLMALIMVAYDVTPDRISGIPISLTTELYDVEGSCDQPMKPDQALRMLQTLLAERFKLAVHRESKERPIYALVVGKRGTKLTESTDPASKPDMQRAGGGFVYKSAPISTLTLILTQALDRPVVDKTGLAGKYDFTLEFARERRGPDGPRDGGPVTEGLPSIFTAVQDQLGLKLEPQKGPVEYIVVDHAERPTEN